MMTMSLDYSVMGARLKKARIAKGYTQEQLAEKIDVSVAFLSRVERGKTKLNLNRLNQLCDLLDISEGDILTGVGITSSHYLNEEFAELLKNCPPEKMRLIYDIAKVIVNNG